MQFGDSPACKQHMALWIVSGAQAHDAKQVVGLQALPHTSAPGTVVGLNELLVTSCVPDGLAQVLRLEVLELGAADVRDRATALGPAAPARSAASLETRQCSVNRCL